MYSTVYNLWTFTWFALFWLDGKYSAPYVTQNIYPKNISAQKLYQGLIVCLGSAPYWTIGSDINEYRSQKYMNRRVTECLSVLGYLRRIYVSSPEIVICRLELASIGNRNENNGLFFHKSGTEVKAFQCEISAATKK